MAQLNTPAARPKHPELSDKVTIKVPKETRDDMQEPNALINDYFGEDANFKSTRIVKDTPKFFQVEADRKEMEDYNQRCIDEHKEKLMFKESDKRFKLNTVTVSEAGISQEMVKQMVQDAVASIGDADG